MVRRSTLVGCCKNSCATVDKLIWEVGLPLLVVMMRIWSQLPTAFRSKFLCLPRITLPLSVPKLWAMPVQSEMDTDEEYSQPAELHHQEAISAVGTIWGVRNLEFAGILRFCADPHPCYVREEMLCFWKALCKEYDSYENRVCAICGDSGVGKSIVLFAWAMWLVTAQQQTVLWVSAFEDAFVTITLVIGGQATTVVPCETNPVAIANILLQSYSGVPIRAIILDGFVQDMSAAVTRIRSSFNKTFIVHCSSVGNLKSIECDNETVNMKHHFMCGWSVDDLVAAWRAGRANQAALLTPEVTMDPKLFLRQLYYAGGSYRYMQLPVTCVKDILDYSSDLVGSIRSFTKLLLPQQDVLPAPVYLVTHVRLGGTLRAVPLSSYVVHCMAHHTTDIDAISTLRSVLPDHPMWQGWCFELYLLTIFHTAARVNYTTGRVGSAGGCIEGVRVNCGVLRANYNPKRFEPFKIIPYADCQHLKRVTHDAAVCYQPERWHDDLSAWRTCARLQTLTRSKWRFYIAVSNQRVLLTWHTPRSSYRDCGRAQSYLSSATLSTSRTTSCFLMLRRKLSMLFGRAR
jgi:hypothetical protein